MKHAILIGNRQLIKNSGGEQPVACLWDWCSTFDNASCGGIDTCNFDYRSGCSGIDSCEEDWD